MKTGVNPPLCEPLRAAGYLLGHLDGIDDNSPLPELCPDLAGTPYLDLLEKLRVELRNVWSTRAEWTTIPEVFAGLRQIGVDAVAAGGIYFNETDEGIRVDIPFTPETFEGGVMGMLLAGVLNR